MKSRTLLGGIVAGFAFFLWGFSVMGLVIAAIVKPCEHKECGAAATTAAA